MSHSSPSSWRWWRGKRQVTCSAAPSSSSAQRWWRTPAGAHVLVVPSGGRHGSVAANWGHALEAPAHTDREATDGSSASLFEQHGETAIVVRLIVEIRVIRLGTTFDWCLQNKKKGLQDWSELTV